MALPLLDGDSKIVLTTKLESKPYVNMTIKVMNDFGVSVQETEYGYFVKGNQIYKKRDYVVEGDWSQAAFFLVAGSINGDIMLRGLDINSIQGDKEIINVLRKFGANIEVHNNDKYNSVYENYKDKENIVNDNLLGNSLNESYIHVKKSNLNGIEIDVADIPDTVPSIAVAAMYANGKTIIKGGERLRLKESDRIESVVSNLRKLGVQVEEKQDGMIIDGIGNMRYKYYRYGFYSEVKLMI